jgi:hypothetical protein
MNCAKIIQFIQTMTTQMTTQKTFRPYSLFGASRCRAVLRLFAPAGLAMLLTGAQAETFSLAGDFTYAANTATSVWSFRMDDYANDPPTFLPLLDDTSRHANTIWGTSFADPPAMWTEGGGYWGIGKNTSGVEQTAGGIVWAPDEVLLHPRGGGSPARVVICWRAPRAMVVSIHESFRKAMPAGNGIGYELRKRAGGTDTEIVGFGAGNIGAGVTRDHPGLGFATGDQLFWRIDTWGDAGGDITGAAIEITELADPPAIVTPPAGGAVAAGCNFKFSVAGVGAASYEWRKNGDLIPGATSATYSVVDAVAADAASYTVTLSGPGGPPVTSAPAVLTFTPLPAYPTILLNENFNGYTGNQNGLQYQTGLKVSHSGTVPGWGRTGGGVAHAVDRTGGGLEAVMIWQDNVITLDSAIAANQSGETYHVDFVAAPATYVENTQATTADDAMVIDVLRGDDSVLATYTCYPGVFGAASFSPFSFQYVGDGSGGVRMRVGPLAAAGHFCGAIDNLRVATNYVPLSPPEITAGPTGGTVAQGSDFTFSVQANGLPTYQWRKEGNPIPGATSASYPVSDVRTGDAGSYTVTLTNGVGAVTSPPALLNVTPAPVFNSYAEAVLTDGPIHYYPLDETSGTDAADLGQLATTGGTYTGGFTLGQASVSAGLGNCLCLDGAPGSFVDLGLFHPGDSVTVEAWAKLDLSASHDPAFHDLVGRMDGSYILDLAPGDAVQFAAFNDSGTIAAITGASPVARNQWYHLVGVFSGGTATVYVNGVKGASRTIGGVLRNLGPTPDRVLIGASRNGSVSSFNWKGCVDEVAIYDTALSITQIRSHFRAGAPAPQVTALGRTGNDTSLSFTTFPGFSYRFENSNDLTQWFQLGDLIPGDGTVKTATNSSTDPHGFYRMTRIP